MKKLSKAVKVALYARISTDKQNKESPDDQLRKCREFCERNGWTVAAEFKDEAISGGTANRPAYQQMLEQARGKAFDLIVCEDMKRLWREQAEQWRCLKEWVDLGIRLRTLSGIDSGQKGFDLIAAVMGAAAEMDRTECSYRIRRGLEARALKKQPTGGRVYGYNAAKGGKVTVNKAEAAVVRRIFNEYIAGRSPRAIAHGLNRDGIPSPGASWKRKRRSGKWLQTAVRGTLRVERYTGRIAWGRHKVVRSAADSSQRKYVPGDEPIEYRHEDLRIIDDRTWQAAQRRIKEMQPRDGQVQPQARPHRHALSGLLCCDVCEASYVISNARDYGCSQYRCGGKYACNNGRRINRDVLERAIFDGLAEHLQKPEWVEEYSAWFRKQVTAGQKAQAATAAVSDKRLAQLDVEIRNLTDAIVRGEFRTSAALAGKLRELEAERSQLTQGRQQPSNVVRLLPRLSERYRALVRDLPGMLRKDPARARVMLRRLIGGQIRMVPKGDGLVADIRLTGTQIALATGTHIGHFETGGAGGGT